MARNFLLCRALKRREKRLAAQRAEIEKLLGDQQYIQLQEEKLAKEKAQLHSMLDKALVSKSRRAQASADPTMEDISEATLVLSSSLQSQSQSVSDLLSTSRRSVTDSTRSLVVTATNVPESADGSSIQSLLHSAAVDESTGRSLPESSLKEAGADLSSQATSTAVYRSQTKASDASVPTQLSQDKYSTFVTPPTAPEDTLADTSSFAKSGRSFTKSASSVDQTKPGRSRSKDLSEISSSESYCGK